MREEGIQREKKLDRQKHDPKMGKRRNVAQRLDTKHSYNTVV